MTEKELKKALIAATEQFEEEYLEWEDYSLTLRPDDTSVAVYDDSGSLLSIAEAKEILCDFSAVLKSHNLMLGKELKDAILVEEYSYLVEDGLDELADELEMRFGKFFTKLKVVEKDNKPYIRFQYIGNMTSEQKEQLRSNIIDLVNQYQAVDEDDLFADVDFDDFDEIMEEVKAEDSDRFDFEIFIKKVTDADLTYLEDYFKLSEDWEEDEKLTDYEVELYVMEDTIRITIWYNTNYKDADIDFDFAKTAENLDILGRYEDNFENVEYADDEETKAEDFVANTYQVIVDNDAAVEFTEEDLLDVLSEEDLEALKAGETIQYEDIDGGMHQVSLVKDELFAEDMLTDILARDEYQLNENITVTPENEPLIWRAERDLINNIEFGDKEQAEMIFKFIYNFNLVDAAFEHGQFEDLLERKEKYEREIANIESNEIKAVDEVEIDYTDYEALADLYNELYDKLLVANPAEDIADNELLDQAFTEIDEYLAQFGPQSETVPDTLARMSENEIDGYLEIINKWMNYTE